MLQLTTIIKKAIAKKIIFTDKSKVKLPSSKSVLKIVGKEKSIIQVDDLNQGDKVLIYENPDRKKLSEAIFELKHPELVEKARQLRCPLEKLLERICRKFNPGY